jgi:hypothetical protein
MSIAEIFAAYEAAMADEDRIAANSFLAALEDERFRNEADWKVIFDYCQKNNFSGRLEVITKGLIKHDPAVSGKAVFGTCKNIGSGSDPRIFFKERLLAVRSIMAEADGSFLN